MKILNAVVVGLSALMMIGAMAAAQPVAASQIHPASIRPWVSGSYGSGQYYHHRRHHHHHHHHHAGIVVHL